MDISGLFCNPLGISSKTTILQAKDLSRPKKEAPEKFARADWIARWMIASGAHPILPHAVVPGCVPQGLKLGICFLISEPRSCQNKDSILVSAWFCWMSGYFDEVELLLCI